MRIAIGVALVGLLFTTTDAESQYRDQPPEPSFLQRLGRALKADSEWNERHPVQPYYVPPPQMPQRCTTQCLNNTFGNTCHTTCF